MLTLKDFKLGDIVQLRSGGPKMTVRNVSDESDRHHFIYCDWFAGSKSQRAQFPPASLIKIAEEEEQS